MDDKDNSRTTLDHEQLLNTMFYEKNNLILLTSKFIRRLYEECLESDKLDIETLQEWNDQEVINLIPPIYCADADVIKITFPDDTVLYKLHYNVPFQVMDEDFNICEGDEPEDDFYE